MRTVEADLVVVGAGLAGLACALSAGGRVLLLTKAALACGGSSWRAKGGIAAALGAGDSPQAHADDTLRAACGVADPAVVGSLTARAPEAVRWLDGLGVPFDRGPDGHLALGREAAHAADRIVHAHGDATGRAVVEALVREVRGAGRISVLEHAFAQDLLIGDGVVRGVIAYDDDAGWLRIVAPRTVLATGGIGALYPRTTNPPAATGDGLAMAARAGAELADLEFVQFHPTALDAATVDGTALPLLTEALRGAGARLVLADGSPALPPGGGGDLAPRDVVARAVARRLAAGDTVRLDLRPALAARGVEAFPQAVNACREAGLDPLVMPVPVTPAAHFHMGGVLTDGQGRTSLPGLWACGEVASAGVHGANRLASNALLEALVFGERVARDAAGYAPPAGPTPAGAPALGNPVTAVAARLRVRQIAGRALGLERDGATLAQADELLAGFDREINDSAAPAGASTGRLAAVRAWSEARNLALVARLVAHAATRREESRGAHVRHDFPRPDHEWARRLVLTFRDLPERAGVAAVVHDAA